jgi:hypothetical protein
MNPRNSWILVVLAAGLFAYIYFVERRQPPPPPVLTRIWTGTNVGDVTEVKIDLGNNQNIRLEQTNGVWQMTEPVIYAAQGRAVQHFLEALAQLTPRRLSAKDLQGHTDIAADYGFDEPSRTVLVQQGEDNKFLLRLGKTTAPGDEIYGQIAGSDDVYIISTDFLKYFPKDTDDWRERGFVNLGGDSFNHLTVTVAAHPGEPMELDHSSSNHLWTMIKPTPSPANSPLINSLLVDLVFNTHVTRFVPENPPVVLATVGLQTPQLTLTLSDGTNAVAVLQFGAVTNDEVYARASPQSPVVLVSRGSLTNWTEDPNSFRDPLLASTLASRVADFATNAFTIDEIGANNQTNFSIRKGTNGPIIYVVDSDQKTNLADGQQIISLLTNLFTLEIARPYTNSQAFAIKDLPLPESLGDFGLADSNLVRRYLIQETPLGGQPVVLADVMFGFPNTNNPGTICARRAQIGDQAVYAVWASDVARLPDTALQLRARQIWKFDSTDINKLIVSTNGAVRTLDHKEEFKWLPSVGFEDPVKSAGIEQLVSNLGELSAESWIGPAGADLAKYGLADRALHVQLIDKNNVTYSVDFGDLAPAGGGRYGAVTVGAQKWIFIYSAVDTQHLNDWIWLPDSPKAGAVPGTGGG